MQCGLYGKLPAKRDFIAVATPREFLTVWEPWIQGAISASTLKLGTHWRTAFLRAPIWRFWLGAELCGHTVIGAFMPSLDGIGRYFPLTLFTSADDDGAFPPPELDPQIEWFGTVERFLLWTLEEGVSFEEVSKMLIDLKRPPDRSVRAQDQDVAVLDEGTIVANAEKLSFSQAFASTRLANHGSAYASSTYWWTAGGEGFPALALAKRRMPDPNVFAGMLTGDFEYVRK